MPREPLARIELATYALPRRRYTPKPQWRQLHESGLRFNRYGKKSKDYIQELHHWQFTVLHIRMQPHRSMIGTNMLIYSLAGVVVLLSVILFVRVIRSRPTVSPDPWQTPLPMNSARQRRRAPQPMVVPPPPQMFQQR